MTCADWIRHLEIINRSRNFNLQGIKDALRSRNGDVSVFIPLIP